MKTTHCTRCGDDFDEEEEKNPRLDKDSNEPICDDCYRELFEIVCPLCEESFDNPQTFEPDQFIFAPIGVDLPGIYRVLEWPFFRSWLVGDAYFIDGSIELVKPMNKDVEEGQFICPDCIEKHIQAPVLP